MKIYVLSTLLMVLLLSMVPVVVAEVNLDEVTMKLREKSDGQVKKRLRLPERDAISLDKRKPRDDGKVNFRQYKKKGDKGLKGGSHKEKALDAKGDMSHEQLKRKIFKGKYPIGDDKKKYHKKNKQRHEKLLKAKREIDAIDDPALRAEKIKAMKMKAMKTPTKKRALFDDKNMSGKNIIQEREKLDAMYKKVNLIKDDNVREEKLKYLEGYRKKIKGMGSQTKKDMDIDKSRNKNAIRKEKIKQE